MVRPKTALDYKILAFYQNINPGRDFSLKRPPASDLVERRQGPANRRASGRYPLAYKLTDAYIDLGFAIENNQWDKAYAIYRYMTRMLEN